MATHRERALREEHTADSARKVTSDPWRTQIAGRPLRHHRRPARPGPVTSARNARLVAICQHVYSSVTGVRAVEALASGIPFVTEALAEAGLPAARYMDSGIRFTVMLRQPAVSGNEKTVYDLLAHGPRTVAALENATGIPGYTIRRVLRSLRATGLVEQEGGKGQATTYRHTKRR